MFEFLQFPGEHFPAISKQLKTKIRSIKIWQIQKSQQHPKGFPGGPPPQYWPGLSPLDFRVRMGSGIFDEVWPLANVNANSWVRFTHDRKTWLTYSYKNSTASFHRSHFGSRYTENLALARFLFCRCSIQIEKKLHCTNEPDLIRTMSETHWYIHIYYIYNAWHEGCIEETLARRPLKIRATAGWVCRPGELE